MSRLWSMARNLFSRPAPAPVAQPVRPQPTPQGDLKDRARRTAEKIRTWVVAGRLSILPWLDNQTQETEEIRAHYRVMLREPTLFSAVRANVLSVSHQDVQVHPEDPDDPAQQEVARAALWALQKSRGGTAHIAHSVLFGGVIDGWSLSEVVLRKEPERYGPCKGRLAIQAFKAKDSKYLQLIVDAYKNVIGVRASGFGPVRVFEGADLESFVLYTHFGLFESPIGMSAFRCAYRAYWIKEIAWSMRALFVERQATPGLMGTYTTIDQKAALEEALEEMGSRTWTTVPTGALVTPISLAGGGEAAFASAISDCDKEMLVGVCGAHLPFMEGTTSDPRGDTNVQKEVAQLIQWSLSASLGEAVTRQCLAPWTRLNYGEQMPPPTATWGAVSEQAMMASAQLDEQLQKIGLSLSKKERYSYYGRQEPRDDGDALKPGGGPSSSSLTPPGQTPPPGAGGPGGGGTPPGLPPADQEFGESYDPDAPAGWYGGEQDWSQVRGERGGTLWVNKSGRKVYSKENPGKSRGKGAGDPVRREEVQAKYDTLGRKKGQRAATGEQRQASHARAREMLASKEKVTSAHIDELHGHLMNLSVDEIHDLKKEGGVKASGRKHELARKVAERLIAGVKPATAPHHEPRFPVNAGTAKQRLNDPVRPRPVFPVAINPPYKGNLSPNSLGREEREALPLIDVPTSSIYATQSTIQPAKVEAIQQGKAKDASPPFAVATPDGKVYLVDGNHRATADVLAGKESIPLRVLHTSADGSERIGFSGKDSLGREWRDGKLVAAREKSAGQSQPAKPPAPAPAPRELHVSPTGQVRYTTPGQPAPAGYTSLGTDPAAHQMALARLAAGTKAKDVIAEHGQKKTQSSIDNTSSVDDNTSGGSKSPSGGKTMEKFTSEPGSVDVPFPEHMHAKAGKGARFVLKPTPHSPMGGWHGQVVQIRADGTEGRAIDGQYFKTPEAAGEWLNGKIDLLRSQLAARAGG